jgi:hypothetical protein
MKTSKQFHNVKLSVIKYSFYNYDKKGDIKISFKQGIVQIFYKHPQI